jgi:hypothetical protein
LPTAGKYCDRDIVVTGKGGDTEGAYNEGYKDGQKNQLENFWNTFLADTSSFYQRFSGKGFSDANFYPTKDIIIVGSGADLFSASIITDLAGRLKECGVVLDTSGATNLSYGFNGSTITRLPILDLTNCTNNSNFVGVCNDLVYIEKLIVSEKTPAYNFNNAALEYVIFNGVIDKNGWGVSACKKLTHKSLMSIINTLKDYSGDTSGTTYKITFGSINIAKLTEDELYKIEEKGWQYA